MKNEYGLTGLITWPLTCLATLDSHSQDFAMNSLLRKKMPDIPLLSDNWKDYIHLQCSRFTSMLENYGRLQLTWKTRWVCSFWATVERRCSRCGCENTIILRFGVIKPWWKHSFVLILKQFCLLLMRFISSDSLLRPARAHSTCICSYGQMNADYCWGSPPVLRTPWWAQQMNPTLAKRNPTAGHIVSTHTPALW